MKVLVVDDHEELRQYVGEALLREGYSVASTASVAATLAALKSEVFDLVVLDLALPDGSGTEICQLLRREYPDTCVLVLTANTAVASRVTALDAGADDYLMKPFALAELRARVRALLRRKTNFRMPAPYHVGELQLNFETKVALVQGKPAPITAREWKILWELGAAFPASVTRTDLLARAWPDGGESKGASLDVLLSRLRQKLGADALVSRRGLGVALRGAELPPEE